MVKRLVVMGLLGVIGISLIAQTQYGLFLSLGSTIDYNVVVSNDPKGDTTAAVWGPTTDGTTIYNANDGGGNRTINGVVYSGMSDGNAGVCIGENSIIVKYPEVNYATPATTSIVAVNCMLDWGSTANPDAPPGWWGMLTSGDVTTGAPGVTGHIQRGVSIQGYRFFFGQRGNTGDVEIIMSPPDDTSPMATWCNYAHCYKYTVSFAARVANVTTLTTSTNTFSIGDKIWPHGANIGNGVHTVTAATATTVSFADVGANVTIAASGGTVGIMSTGGDAGKCDAAFRGGACLNAEYTTSMIWRGPDSTFMSSFTPIVYGQDGAGTGPNGSSTYFYYYTYSGYQYLHRIALIDLLGGSFGDPTKHTHYSCSTYSQISICDGMDNATWSANPQLSTAVTGAANYINNTGQNEGPTIYLTGTGSYHQLVDLFYGTTKDMLGVASSPTPWGPWTVSSTLLIPGGTWKARDFPTFLFPFALQPTATSYSIPMLSEDTTATAGNPMFQQMTLNYRHPVSNRQWNNTQAVQPVSGTAELNLIPMIGHFVSNLTQKIFTFFDSAPNQGSYTGGPAWANVDMPIGTDRCDGAQSGGGTQPTFSNYGMVWPIDTTHFNRCITGTNVFPVTGNNAFTASVAFTITDVNVERALWSTGTYTTAGGGALAFGVGNGYLIMFDGGASQVTNMGSIVVSTGTPHVLTFVKSGTGSTANTMNSYLDGVYICGASRGSNTPCPSYSTVTPNLVASVLRFGVGGTADTGNGTVGPRAWFDPFAGTIYGFRASALGYSDTDVKIEYNAFKSNLALRGIVLP